MNNTKKCIGKDSFQRMNYLYQLSNQLATENQSAHIASVQYANLAVNISKKAVLRLDADLKNTICKSCRSLLLPGITCKVRIKKKRIIKHCLKCNHMKIFDTRNQDYVTWNQRSESLVELLDYSATQSENEESKKVKLEEMDISRNKM
ncbi:ribonuclease P protein subunit rpr2 [Dendroctonus ponderosae]